MGLFLKFPVSQSHAYLLFGVGVFDFKFIQIVLTANVVDAEFSPLPLGSACVLSSGRASRGKTPLHFAAQTGHDSVVEQLLEAKAAVDVKENDNGRFLRRGFAGETC